ncbi:Molybdopterin-guanine dinucleotide biosynthesis adapter protein [compost metagenome]
MEGFKHEPISKIVLYREEVGKPLADMLDQHVIAVASDKKIEGVAPLLDINQPATIAGFIVQWLKQTKA